MCRRDSHFEWQGTDLLLQIRVSPRSSRDQVLGLMGNWLKISITAPPVDGKANTHLQAYLARQFGVPRSLVTLVSGMKGRNKTVRISGPATLPTEFLLG